MSVLDTAMKAYQGDYAGAAEEGAQQAAQAAQSSGSHDAQILGAGAGGAAAGAAAGGAAGGPLGAAAGGILGFIGGALSGASREDITAEFGPLVTHVLEHGATFDETRQGMLDWTLDWFHPNSGNVNAVRSYRGPIDGNTPIIMGDFAGRIATMAATPMQGNDLLSGYVTIKAAPAQGDVSQHVQDLTRANLPHYGISVSTQGEGLWTSIKALLARFWEGFKNLLGIKGAKVGARGFSNMILRSRRTGLDIILTPAQAQAAMSGARVGLAHPLVPRTHETIFRNPMIPKGANDPYEFALIDNQGNVLQNYTAEQAAGALAAATAHATVTGQIGNNLRGILADPMGTVITSVIPHEGGAVEVSEENWPAVEHALFNNPSVLKQVAAQAPEVAGAANIVMVAHDPDLMSAVNSAAGNGDENAMATLQAVSEYNLAMMKAMAYDLICGLLDGDEASTEIVCAFAEQSNPDEADALFSRMLSDALSQLAGEYGYETAA